MAKKEKSWEQIVSEEKKMLVKCVKDVYDADVKDIVNACVCYTIKDEKGELKHCFRSIMQSEETFAEMLLYVCERCPDIQTAVLDVDFRYINGSWPGEDPKCNSYVQHFDND